ncbi:MAG TPA: cytochrome C [Xanthobacteraceae bacterium]|nr:cytochrome C [Xanthobacteraceae bacterium]
MRRADAFCIRVPAISSRDGSDAMAAKRTLSLGLLRRIWVVAAAGFFGLAWAPPAQALPSFARQTGQPCGTCHTDFPALTPYGRRFKLLGYTVGGGMFRTTPFSPAADNVRAEAAKMGLYLKAAKAPANDDKDYVPPVALMAIIGYTHTQADLAPPTDPWKPNDNIVISPVSGFWGGAIADNIGAFAQVTYNAPGPGGFSDPFGHTWTWDNTDVRFVKTAHIGGIDAIFGLTANNNPTVQDVWNTTPAWAFPYAVSTVASTPATKTTIEGAFSAHVVGFGAYAYIADLLYLEATLYRTLDFGAQNSLGVDPYGAGGLIDGVSPYWRLALEPHWNNNYLMVGTFGSQTNVHNWINPGTGDTSTFAQTDKFTDIGFDAQYQYQGDNYWLTLRGSYIHEFQQLDSTFSQGGSANLNNDVNSLHLQASFAYGLDNRIVLTGQYFNVWGSSDPILYSGLASGFSPNSDGFIAEIAYIPFSASKAPGWPWGNVRIGLDYTFYNKFDGTTVGASANNTLFLHLWFAM